MENSLKHRLLQDIAEMKSSPYPCITLHFNDNDIAKACLILNPEGYHTPMHLTIEFLARYPLVAPKVRMDSQVMHPNVFGGYICASILNTTEGYTLKGIAIQLLSFFGSDNVQQSYGEYKVNMSDYKNLQSHMVSTYKCRQCNFGAREVLIANLSVSHSPTARRTLNSSSSPPPPLPKGDSDKNWPSLSPSKRKPEVQDKKPARVSGGPKKTLNDLPGEVLLMIVEMLETEDIWKFKEAFARIGAVIIDFDVIRTRELQCFALKQDYLSTKLGVGVKIVKRGKFGSFESEFDLLSHEGFTTLRIRTSVMGVPFSHYLPSQSPTDTGEKSRPTQ